MFTLALIFAGTNNVFGQALDPRTTPDVIDPLNCSGTANFLHPVAGLPYTYQMDGTSGDEDVLTWTWFATKNPVFISAAPVATDAPVLSSDSLQVGVAGELLDATNGVYGESSSTDNVSITWSPEILANTVYQTNPTFVVGYGKGVNCADNIQVYEINPIMSFTIDIANIDATGTTLDWEETTEQCVDVVQSAEYNTTSHELTMDYGKDTLYFEITAANFVKNWTPTFDLISGLTDVQTAELGLATSYANAVAGTFITGATTSWDETNVGIGNGWATGVALTANDPNDVAAGVSVFLRVIITNDTYESLTDNIFELAVDAIDDDAAGIWDMEDEDCDTTTADDSADQIDRATHTVTPRPTIEDANVPDTNAILPDYRITKTGE